MNCHGGAGDMSEDVELRLRSDPRLLRAVRNLVRCYLADAGFPEERCQEAVLAVDEACTNAIRHSYASDPEQQLTLRLASGREWITVTLHDEGRPAPADKVQPRDLAPADPATIQPGGLGVGLIYEVFDDVVYTPGKRAGNCIVMRMRRPAA